MCSAVSCLLCLEIIVDPIGQIDIESSESQALNVQPILEKYFKVELSAALKAHTAHTICQQCWETVRTFHQFCLRVQDAHTTLTATIAQRTKEERKEETVSIKIEDSSTEDAAPFPKRRQGRSRRKLLLENEVAPQVQNNHKALEKHVDELHIEEIKVEVLPEEPMDTAEPELVNTADCNTASRELYNSAVRKVKSKKSKECISDVANNGDWISRTTEDNCHDPDFEVSKPKRNKKRISNTVEEDNEFIAQNFELTCCLCDSPLENFAYLKKHFRVQHMTKGYVLCCGKKLLERKLLVDHLHVHKDPQYFRCSECGKALADRHCLELHLRYHKASTERIYKCDICSKKFIRRDQLLRHSDTHIEEKNYSCPECEKAFPSKISMTCHLNKVHLNKYAYICDVCGKAIHTREDLQRHKDEHAGIKQPPVKCELCGAIVTTLRGLKRHTAAMHKNENRKPHSCHICGHVSTSLQALKRHIRYMHTIEKKHTCSVCAKAFKRSEQLREHMSTHTGEVLYTCSFCQRPFISKSNMHAHCKKMHLKEWQEKRLQKFNVLPKEKEENQEN